MTQLEQSVLTGLRECAVVRAPAFGVLRLRGNDRIDLLHRLSTNDLRGMKPGEVKSTVLTSEKGRIVDAVTVALFEASALLLCSKGKEEALTQWFEKFIIIDDFQYQVLTHLMTSYSYYGPEVFSTVKTAFGIQVEPGAFAPLPFASGKAILLATAGALGTAVHVLMETGGETPSGSMLPPIPAGVPELDLEGAEAFRIASGIPGPAGELTAEHTPYDVGLGDLIDFRKGCYVGQEVIARLDTYQKVRRALAGLWCRDGVHAEPGSALLSGSEPVGTLTSVSPVVVAGRRPGLAVMRTEFARAGSAYTDARGGIWTVEPLPQRPWVS